MTKVSIASLILAGGQSSRLGQDKALIPVRGVPLLRYVCDVALQCTPTVCIVTAWPERYEHIVPANCRLIREIPDHVQSSFSQRKTASHGPLVGFAQGLAQLETDWTLLLACDLPHLQSQVLQLWIEQLAQVPTSAIALLPRHAKGWEPLCGFYRSSARSSLNAFIEQGGRSAQGIRVRTSANTIR
ncbi:MAG: molybdenum cofactor guanylyltransferase [Cyanothece sp. SIO1E1]|nr:molybdenum cofactor guanylyltransferase [Cyanothece sp. SIO1E1]